MEYYPLYRISHEKPETDSSRKLVFRNGELYYTAHLPYLTIHDAHERILRWAQEKGFPPVTCVSVEKEAFPGGKQTVATLTCLNLDGKPFSLAVQISACEPPHASVRMGSVLASH